MSFNCFVCVSHIVCLESIVLFQGPDSASASSASQSTAVCPFDPPVFLYNPLSLFFCLVFVFLECRVCVRPLVSPNRKSILIFFSFKLPTMFLEFFMDRG